MEQVKGQIYELMGIADIQRGQSDPNDTLGAQIIKSNNAMGRLKTQQHAVVDFATSLLCIKAQIICNHFTDDTIIKISGAMQLSPQDQALVPQALELLRDEASKNFRIEVTSDSMIYQDEQQEKQDRIAFLSAVGSFMQSALPAAAQSPELTPMLCEMLKFGVTAFKAGKQLEGIIDQTADDLRKQYEQTKGQPKPPPIEMQKAQMQMQGEQAKIQAQAQLKQQELQANSQAKQAEMQMSAQLEMQKLQAEMQLEKAKQEYQAQENQLKFQLEEQRNTADREMEAKLLQMKMNMERNTALLLAYVNNGAKIEQTRISAGLDDGQEAYDDSIEKAQHLEHPLAPVTQAITDSNAQLTQMISALSDSINKPKTVIRGSDGKIVGVQ
jgi:hypothetical protein